MKILLNLALLCLLSAPSISQTAPPQKSAFKKVHAYTHEIYQRTILDGANCSATAVGPHALLTASHCEMPTTSIVIDDSDDASKIVGIARDGQDHTIYIVDATFTDYATISAVAPEVGDDVFMFGNPGKKTDVFRKGYVSHIQEASESLFSATPALIMYDMNGFEGDSGAGIFNNAGELVGVVSLASIETSKGDKAFNIKLMVCLSLAFTSEQLKLLK